MNLPTDPARPPLGAPRGERVPVPGMPDRPVTAVPTPPAPRRVAPIRGTGIATATGTGTARDPAPVVAGVPHRHDRRRREAPRPARRTAVAVDGAAVAGAVTAAAVDETAAGAVTVVAAPVPAELAHRPVAGDPPVRTEARGRAPGVAREPRVPEVDRTPSTREVLRPGRRSSLPLRSSSDRRKATTSPPSSVRTVAGR